jgi:hypothetical protein
MRWMGDGGRGAGPVNRRGDVEAAADGRGGQTGRSGGRGRGVGRRRGLERFCCFGSAGGWCRCGGVTGGRFWGVRDAAASWGGILRSRLGAWDRPGCERARELPHPLGVGRADAPRGERLGRRRRRRQAAARGRFRVPASLGLRRWPGKPTIPGCSPWCRSLERRAQMARSTCFKAKRPSTQCGHRFAQNRPRRV